MEISNLLNLDSFEAIHPLAYIGLLLLLSYAAGKIANRFKIPRVSGYLVVGMIISPSVLGLFHEKVIEDKLTIITDIALAFIAFSIGGSLKMENMKKLGKTILVITLTEGIGAFLLVTGFLSLIFSIWYATDSAVFWSLYFPVALLIGSISAATAPAATLAIVHEYGAKGPFTTILLGVVALDDGVAIILFAFAIAIGQSFVHHSALHWQTFLLTPFFSILLSLSIGAVFGLFLIQFMRFVFQRKAMFGVMIGSIFLVAGLATSLDASPLLANMTLGFVVVNFAKHHEDIFDLAETFEEAIFGMFFTLAGAHMDFRVIEKAGWLIVLIVCCQFLGKVLGARLGAEIAHAPLSVKRYLGTALLSKAGVSVGLILVGKEIFGQNNMNEVMVNAVLGSVVINELMTPFCVRFSLKKAGEIRQET